MKRWLLGLLVLLCALVLAVPIAEPALASASDVKHFKGEGAGYSLNVYDEDTNSYTFIEVFVTGELNQQPPGRPQAVRNVMIVVDRYREEPEYQEISVAFYNGDIPASSFVVGPRLSWASLSATDLPGIEIDLINNEGHEVNFDVTMEWTATGPMIRDIETYHYRSPDIAYSSHFVGRSRDASAEGTLSYGSTSLELAASEGPFIYSASAGSVEVSR